MPFPTPDRPDGFMPGAEVHRLSNRIRRLMENNCQRPEAATGNNGRIIRYLSRHEGKDVFQKDLEEAFGITRSTASKVLRLMEQKGLVRREGVPQDARLKKLSLTERSRELTRKMLAEGAAMDKRLLQGFTPEEAARLEDYLERMRHNLEEGEPLK